MFDREKMNASREVMVSAIEGIIKERRKFKADLAEGRITQEEFDRQMAGAITDEIYTRSGSYGSSSSVDTDKVAAMLKPELEFTITVMRDVVVPKTAKHIKPTMETICNIIRTSVFDLGSNDKLKMTAGIVKIVNLINDHSGSHHDYVSTVKAISNDPEYARFIAFTYVETLMSMTQLTSKVITAIIENIKPNE